MEIIQKNRENPYTIYYFLLSQQLMMRRTLYLEAPPGGLQAFPVRRRRRYCRAFRPALRKEEDPCTGLHFRGDGPTQPARISSTVIALYYASDCPLKRCQLRMCQ